MDSRVKLRFQAMFNYWKSPCVGSQFLILIGEIAEKSTWMNKWWCKVLCLHAAQLAITENASDICHLITQHCTITRKRWVIIINLMRRFSPDATVLLEYSIPAVFTEETETAQAPHRSFSLMWFYKISRFFCRLCCISVARSCWTSTEPLFYWKFCFL